MKKLVVALDIDGVVLNFMQSITKFIESTYGVQSSIVHCHDQYSLKKRFNKEWIEVVGWGKIKDEFAKAGGWASIELMHHAEKVRELFTNPVYDVHIVTMIEPEFQLQRKSNLEAILNITIPVDRIHCVSPTASKKPVIDALMPDVFIDDSFGNIEGCAGKHVSIWVDTVAFDNKTEPENKGPHVISVLHFDDAFGHIEKLAYQKNREQLSEILEAIPNVLNDDLLKPMYRKLQRKSKTEGHCYAASEAIYHLLGGSSGGYVPQVARFEDDGISKTHWWLRKGDGSIIDPTAGQFTEVGNTPPYGAGKGAGFLTRQPSKRAMTIIHRLYNR